MNGVFENIFTVNLGVKEDETVLVFTDIIGSDEIISADERERRLALKEIAGAVAKEGLRHCRTVFANYPSVKGHGKEPPEELWSAAFGTDAVTRLKGAGLLERILSKTADAAALKEAGAILTEYAHTPDAVVALSNFSTTHTRFREFLTTCKLVRYASMPLFERSMLEGAMTVDWKALERRTLCLRELVSGGDMVAITTHTGTSITFSIKDREILADTGILTEPGTYGNLPAGEAFTAPLEGTAEGTLILEWTPTRRLKNPITLDVKKGFVVDVSGHEEYVEELKRDLDRNKLCGNIAELGIGTNDRAVRPDNILETEKILGTVHIALGDNASFGGNISVPFHQDFIFFRPTMTVFKGEERIEVLIDGKPGF